MQTKVLNHDPGIQSAERKLSPLVVGFGSGEFDPAWRINFHLNYLIQQGVIK